VPAPAILSTSIYKFSLSTANLSIGDYELLSRLSL
jgi:hypothetical protein